MDKTVEKIKLLQDKDKLSAGRYSFLTHLLSRKQLTYTDVVILTLSLPFDGVSTVYSFSIMLKYSTFENRRQPSYVIKGVQQLWPFVVRVNYPFF